MAERSRWDTMLEGKGSLRRGPIAELGLCLKASGLHVTLSMDLGLDDENGGIVAQLIRHWVNERNSPDILPFESELIERALQFINDQACNPCIFTCRRC